MIDIANSNQNPMYSGNNIEFYEKAVKNNFRSEAEGRDIYDTFNYIRISTPGNTTNSPDRPVYESDKKNYPVQWAAYMATKDSQSSADSGTPLSSWPLVSSAQVQELKYFNFLTVENVAQASDLQVDNLSKVMGMAGYVFRDRARNFLRVAKEDSTSFEQDSKLKDILLENEVLKKKLDEEKELAEARFDAIQKQIMSLSAKNLAEAKDPPKKRGPKPKFNLEDLDQQALGIKKSPKVQGARLMGAALEESQ